MRSTRRRPQPPEESFDRRLLAPMVLGAILNPVNSSIIAISLVPIGAALGEPPARTALLVSSLYVATAVGQPVTGRLVDLYGPRRLFLVGATLTIAAGVLGALAPSLAVLVVARVVLGLGTCAGYPAAMALIASEGRRTGTSRPAGVLTILSIATQTISVIGPTAGGLLIGLGGWRTTFAVNVPLGATALVVGALTLPRPAPGEGDRPPGGLVHGLDVPGMALFTATLVAMLAFLTHPSVAKGWLVAVAVAAAVGLVVRELRAATPFVDVRVLLGDRAMLATYARVLLGAVVSYSFLYGFTQWLQEGRGLSPSGAGLLLVPTFAIAVAVAALTGRREAVRGKLVAGAAGQVVVSAALLTVSPTTGVVALVAVVAVMGVPQGLVNLGNQNALYRQADPARLASSAGLLRTFFYLGAIIASTAAGLLFPAGATSAGMHDLAWLMLAAAAGLLVLSLADRSLRAVGLSVAQADAGEDAGRSQD